MIPERWRRAGILSVAVKLRRAQRAERIGGARYAGAIIGRRGMKWGIEWYWRMASSARKAQYRKLAKL